MMATQAVGFGSNFIGGNWFLSIGCEFRAAVNSVIEPFCDKYFLCCFGSILKTLL